MSAKPALEPTLRALVTRDRRGLSQHPTPETLVAYHAGELPNVEEEQLRDHLALCPECAELLLDLVSFADFNPPEETAPLADSEVEAAWQKVQPQIVDSGIPVVRSIREIQRAAAAGLVPRQRLMQAYALAATLFLGVVGLSVWGVSLKRQIVDRSKPQSDVEIAYAVSIHDSTRGSDAKEEIKAPGRGRFVVRLQPAVSPEEFSQYPDFAAEIQKAGSGGIITSLAGLRLRDEMFSIELPGQFFPPGVYLVNLYGVDKNRRDKLDTFSFQITSP